MKARTRVVLFVLIPMVLLAFQSSALAIEVSGTISADTVWDLNLNPYTVTGDIIISEGVTLVIRPGVVVEFANASSSSEGYHMEVNGALTARGSADLPIVFTSKDKTRYFEYIEFTETSQVWSDDTQTGSILDHCIVEYAGNGSGSTHGQAAVRVISTALSISDSMIRYSKSKGILCYGGVLNITGNRVHHTTCGITLLEPLSGIIQNNYLIENDQGIAVDSADQGLEISGNTVVSSSGEGYGACLGIGLMFHDRLASYIWEQINGPVVTLSDAESIYPDFTVPDVIEDESFVFQLTVTNMDGLVSVDTVTVNTGWENQKPVADAGIDQDVSDGAQVILDASSSFDADDGIVTWAFLQTSGTPVTLTTSNETKQARFTAPAVTGPVDEVLIFQVTVTDTGGLSDSDTVLVTVSDSTVHPVPVADAGPLQTVDENIPVTLSGSLLNDIADNINVVSWFWTKTQGDYVVLNNATGQNATFTVTDVPAEGASYTFQLTVTDDQGQESTDTVIVNVRDTTPGTPNQAPTAVASVSSDTVLEGAANVTLDGHLSTDPELNIETYAWAQVSGSLVTLSSTATPGEKRFTAPNVTKDETLVFRLTVTDVGDLRAVDEVSVLVSWVNEPPVADAGDDQEVNEGLRVLLNGTASSDDQGISTYQWAQVSGTAVTLFNDETSKAYFKTPDLSDDEILVFSLTVSDGAFISQDVVLITVIAGDEHPVADAGPDQVVAYDGAVTLDGSASQDPEDLVAGIRSYLWEQTSGPDVTLYDATTATPYFTAPSEGTQDYISLIFRLTVKDNEDQSGVDTVVVNVTRHTDGTLPEAYAGEDRTVAVNTVVTLSAAGSSAPDSMPEMTVSGNDFSMDDASQEANAIAITQKQDSNVQLTVTGNNIQQTQGNYLVYLYDFSRIGDGVVMAGNWWGVGTAEEISALIYDGADNTLLPLATHDPFLASVITGVGSTLSYPAMVQVGDEMTVDPDEPVTLDGAETYDPDLLLTYLWEQTQGKTVVLEHADSPTATFNAPAITDEDEDDAAVLEFKMTATDPSGFFDSKTLKVTINTEDPEDAKSFNSSGCFIGTGMGEWSF
ncbi:MAG: right-handed parallel beta-helix repeat-containing protein [Proteobacteria bacterium]|nr:right-handed parallel beta-helix repeat-containing protein [Pseudomonadota bacterium]